MRMDTPVTQPMFEYRVSYRRMLEIQARLLARVLEGKSASIRFSRRGREMRAARVGVNGRGRSQEEGEGFRG